jgi:membrane associated rhomboid family serine protease
MPILSLLKLAERFPVIVSLELAAIIVTCWWWSGGDVEMLTIDARAFHGQPWRLFSAALPHIDVIHLVFNLYWVAVLGSRVEQVFGSLATTLWVLLFAAAPLVAEYALAVGGVGLSGVGYALFGFVWVLAKRDARFSDVVNQQVAQMFIAWFFLCLVLTVAGIWHVANVAHAAGAGFGALAGMVAARPDGYRRPAAAAALAGAVVVVFAAAAYARPYVNFTADAAHELGKIGTLALKDDDNQAAIDALESAVRWRAGEPGWWHNLGIAYQREGRHRDAARAYRRAYELDPTDSDARQLADFLEGAVIIERE